MRKDIFFLWLSLSLLVVSAAFATPLLIPATLPIVSVFFPFLVGGGALALYLVRQKSGTDRQIPHLFTFGRPWDRKLMLSAFWTFLLSTVGFPAVHWLFSAESYSVRYISNIPTALVYWAIVLICVPVQATIEEILFRVLPARFALIQPPSSGRPGSVWSRQGLSLFSAAFFVLPHLGNPEVASASPVLPLLLFYALFGYGTMWLSLESGGFEAAIGMHIANNIGAGIFFSYPVSALPSPSLFVVESPAGSMLDILQLFVSLSLVWLVIHYKKRRQEHLHGGSING